MFSRKVANRQNNPIDTQTNRDENITVAIRRGKYDNECTVRFIWVDIVLLLLHEMNLPKASWHNNIPGKIVVIAQQVLHSWSCAW